MTVCSTVVHTTVKQEIFTTGKFREIAPSGDSRQENFADFQLEELLSFEMRPCLSKSDSKMQLDVGNEP